MFKKILFFMSFILIFTINISAEQVLYDNSSSVIDSGEDICANTEYTLVDEVNTNDRSIFVLDGNNYIKEVIDTNQKEVKVNFPSNIKKIKLLLVNKTDGSYDYSNSYYNDYNVVDCSKEKVSEDYDTSRLKYDITYENRTFIYNGEEKDSYSLKYNTNKSNKLKDVPFKKEITLDESVNIIKLEESFIKEGKEIKRYFEINVIDDSTFTIRKISSFDNKEIKFNNYINFKFLILAIIFILLFLFFYKLERVNRAKRRNFKKKLAKKNRK